jgi:hypothetical protein
VYEEQKPDDNQRYILSHSKVKHTKSGRIIVSNMISAVNNPDRENMVQYNSKNTDLGPRFKDVRLFDSNLMSQRKETVISPLKIFMLIILEFN